MKPRRTSHRKDHFNVSGWCICACVDCLSGPGVPIRCICPGCPCNTGKRVK